MPYGRHPSFKACVAANRDKSNPKAYCAEIKRRILAKRKAKGDRRTE